MHQWTWYRVSVAHIVKYLDPLGGKRWGCDSITPEEVKGSIERNNFEREAWDVAQKYLSGSGARDFHIRRIAYLVKFGSSLEQDHEHPILFEPDEHAAIQNGNHRIAAAQVRGDEEIVVKLLVDEDDPEDAVLKLLPGAGKL